MPDNRVVLPLDKAQWVAEFACWRLCAVEREREPSEHADDCLVPHLVERARMLQEPSLGDVLLPDCRDGKHTPTCPGCSCRCHRHHNLGLPESAWT